MPTTIWESLFDCRLSFRPLLEYVGRSIDKGMISPVFGRDLIADVQAHPVLSAETIDREDIDPEDDVYKRLMSAIFPLHVWERDLAAATLPFLTRSIYATPRFRAILLDQEGDFTGTFRAATAYQAATRAIDMGAGRTLSIYARIAREYYGLDLALSYPLIFGVTDDQDLDRYFKVTIDHRFVEIIARGKVEPLTEHQIASLRTETNNLGLWQSIIPSRNFEMRGLSLFNAIEVTDEEATSSLKQELIESDALTSGDRLQQIQRHVRTVLRRPHVSMGITVRQGDLIYMLNGVQQHDGGSVGLFTEADRYRIDDMTASIYGKCFICGEVAVIEDIAADPERSVIGENMLARGIRNAYIAPLKHGDSVIGVLYVTSPIPGDLNLLNTMKLMEVLPLFSLALNRTIDDLNNKVQQTIREEYTAIHPSVEWRFRQAALRLIESERSGSHATPEPIVFRDVHPLFSVADIRGSSTARNQAIQRDLVDQLIEARSVIDAARAVRPLAILANLAHRITRTVDTLREGVNAGDEAAILHFLQNDIEPLFEHLETFSTTVADAVRHYRSLICHEHGFLYRQRENFETSVAAINDAVSTYIDVEEEKAQTIVPHYFEKHQTDGVDIGIYIGSSLTESGDLNPLYVRELRLWQLLVSVGLARVTTALLPRLAVPLEVTHLILVHSQPLSIRFRMDEKQFDVDGAYNIRYEIIKKRIDKATIRGTGERLTQPGMIAIVYSHDSEEIEYRRYLDFMVASGYLREGIEDLELEELQGVPGLRALRVMVNLETPVRNEAIVPKEIEAAIRKMTTEQ